MFWDFDGTLARRDDLWSGAIVDALRRIDPTITTTASDLRPHLKSGFPWHRPEIVTNPSTPQAWWDRLTPTIVAACTAVAIPVDIATATAKLLPEEFYRPDAWQLIEDARAALTHTRTAGYRNVILSNHGPELPRLVTQLGLDDHVELTITSAIVGAEKPNPTIFQHAIGVTGASPAHSWMIGDDPVADIQGARQAGLPAVLADGAYPDAVGLTVLKAAEHVAATPFD